MRKRGEKKGEKETFNVCVEGGCSQHDGFLTSKGLRWKPPTIHAHTAAMVGEREGRKQHQPAPPLLDVVVNVAWNM